MFDDSPTKAKKRYRPTRSGWLLISGAAIIVLLLCAGGFFFWKYMSLKNHLASTASGTSSTAQQATSRVLHEVAAIYELPGEQPTVARVDDVAKLVNQPFFKDAQQGDYVLVYKGAKLALLYRESIHRLINVGPITVSSSNDTASGSQR